MDNFAGHDCVRNSETDDDHKKERRLNGVDVVDGRGTEVLCSCIRIARKPTSSAYNVGSDYYNMEHKKRGLALIFNHEYFDIKCLLGSRSGTNVDCINLEEVLEDLGFVVSVFHNLGYKELVKSITDASKQNHTDADCIMVFVLTHGGLGMLHAKDECYNTEMLWHSFAVDKCPTLAGKPKMFFIQACQGDGTDKGILMSHRTETDGPEGITYELPIHPDFLISYSTVPGYYSLRNTTLGSWFIQALTAQLKLYGKSRDIQTILTQVSRTVAYDFESSNSCNPMLHQLKQIPCHTSTLTGLVVFGDKK